MTGKYRKSSLIQVSIQPLWLPSVEVQDDWQAKNSKSRLTQVSVQPLRLPSAEVQDDWQAKTPNLT